MIEKDDTSRESDEEMGMFNFLDSYRSEVSKAEGESEEDDDDTGDSEEDEEEGEGEGDKDRLDMAEATEGEKEEEGEDAAALTEAREKSSVGGRTEGTAALGMA